MSFATFSGPIRSGTVKDGTVASGRNTGLVVLSQSFDSGDLTGTVVGTTNAQRFNLPRGSQIIDIVIDQTVAATGGTTAISVGNASGGAQLMAQVTTTAGGRFRGTATAATQLAWQTSTAADTAVWISLVVGTATLTAGRYVVTVVYAQRADDGSQVPTN